MPIYAKNCLELSSFCHCNTQKNVNKNVRKFLFLQKIPVPLMFLEDSYFLLLQFAHLEAVPYYGRYFKLIN